MNKKFWAATFTLSGGIIGAGILGLPYVFAKSGFLVGLFWLICLGVVLLFVNLCLGEITLRTKGIHQLSGYAKEYLGTWGQRLMFSAVIFGIYSALLAYLIGEGESIAKLIPGNIPPIFFGIIFWLIMTLLLREGLKGLKKVETYGVIAVITIIISIFINFFPNIQTSNLITFNSENFILPIGVVLFSLLGFTSIPELRIELKGQEKLLKKAILLGSLIPVGLYIIFSLTFVGILGKEVPEVATLSFGPFTIILGIFTMLTSFFVLSFSLKTTFKYDLKTKEITNFLFTSFIPLVIYIMVYQLNFISFSTIISIGGVISGGITAILILLILKKSKSSTKNNKNPKIQIPINWPIIILLSAMFILGIILEFIP